MISIRETEEQKVYWISDPHLGHNPKWQTPIWMARGFESQPAHDAGIVANINARVRPNDILFMLGDFCLNTTVNQFDIYLDHINCRNIYSLWGNHNNPHEKAVFRKGMTGERVGPFHVETYPYQYKNMIYVGHYVEAAVNGQMIVMAHYPFYVWNEMQHGAWMLCGHSHNGCELSRAETLTGKILDVGVDGHACMPWSFDEIRAVMNKKQIMTNDHHRPDAPIETA